jgi:hypothetical protein
MRTVTLRKSKYAKLYDWVLDDIKDRYAISVIHRKLRDGFGCYDVEKRVITVDSEIAGTVFGLFFLHHELCHFLDETNGRYTDFYQRILRGDTKGMNIEKIVWAAEWHCCSEAIKALKRLGVESNNQFCDKNWVQKYMLPIWVSYYTK